jgi:hypothetical protein
MIMRPAEITTARSKASREDSSIASPTVACSAPERPDASSLPASGWDLAEVTSAARGESSAVARWSWRRESNCAESAAPRTAIARSPATREIALFTPDAIPALCSSTAFRTVVVSGATVAASPRPKTTSAGSTSVT